MKRFLPLLIAACVFGLVYFVTSDPGGTDPMGGPSPGGAQGGATTLTNQRFEGSLASDSGNGTNSQVGGQTQQGSPGGARGSTGVSLENATAEGTLEVILRNPLGGHPIKLGQVRLLDRSTLARGVWARAQISTAAKLDLVATQGQLFVASSEGRAVLPSILDGVIHASGEGYEGWLEWVGPLASPLEMSLRASIDLRVLVVNADGQPIPNCPVVLCLNDPINPRALDQTSTITPSGIANFRRVGATLGSRNDALGFAVRLGLPLVDMEVVPFNHKNLPREPLRLVMPAVGRLMVTIVDGEGEKVSRVDVCLGRLVRSQETGEMEFQGEVYRNRAAGFARFENVPVGVQAVIKLTGTGEKRDLIATVSSPKSAGATEEVTLEWTNSWPVIRARAVDETGKPLADRSGRSRLAEDGVARGGAPIKTDSDGGFDLAINRDWNPGTHRELKLEMFSRPGQAPATARLDLSYQPRPGVTEYGEVRFGTTPKLASGLVFADGQPVAGVQVRIMKQVETKVGTQWAALGSLVATSRQDGTFEIYGEEIPPGPNVVMARRRGYLRAYSNEVRLPTGGLRLNLEPGEDEEDTIGDKGQRGRGPDGQGGGEPRAPGTVRPAGGYPTGTSSGQKGGGQKGG